MAGAFIQSCNSSAEKVEIAQDKLIEANKNLEEANEAYLADIDIYRQETAKRFAANEKSIADFKARVENQKREARVDYNKKIVELEQKNGDFKKLMDDYEAEGAANWEQFKAEFGRNMDELGKAFKDFGTRNVKQ